MKTMAKKNRNSSEGRGRAFESRRVHHFSLYLSDKYTIGAFVGNHQSTHYVRITSNLELLTAVFKKEKTAEGAATHFDGIVFHFVRSSYQTRALLSSLNGGAS